MVMMSTSCFALFILAASHHLAEAFAPAKNNVAGRSPPTSLFYQEWGGITTSAAQRQIDRCDPSKALHIDDSNYELILNNTLSLPVLVDCYTDKCGPCKLIERSLQQALPKFTSSDETTESRPRLQFVKWDADNKENSEQFMSILREYDMTFRKLPTLLLFIDGIPIALKSGMMSAPVIDRFLEENLPDGGLRDGERRPRVGPDGALGVSTRKMNR
jgi:thioredoxin 1